MYSDIFVQAEILKNVSLYVIINLFITNKYKKNSPKVQNCPLINAMMILYVEMSFILSFHNKLFCRFGIINDWAVQQILNDITDKILCRLMEEYCHSELTLESKNRPYSISIAINQQMNPQMEVIISRYIGKTLRLLTMVKLQVFLTLILTYSLRFKILTVLCTITAT